MEEIILPDFLEHYRIDEWIGEKDIDGECVMWQPWGACAIPNGQLEQKDLPVYKIGYIPHWFIDKWVWKKANPPENYTIIKE